MKYIIGMIFLITTQYKLYKIITIFLTRRRKKTVQNEPIEIHVKMTITIYDTNIFVINLVN